jgi:hypothetical protein
MVGGSLAATAERWRMALAREKSRAPVGALYMGRSFAEAKRAAATLDADLYVVSAGLGVVAAHDLVPAYNLTASGRSGGLIEILASHSKQPTDWWNALCDGHGLCELISKSVRANVFLALPSSYVQMVAEDLRQLPVEHWARVRLFTSLPGRNALPPLARESAMPYDDRLESVTGYAGTRADFPQRALRHFVECLAGHRLSADSGCQAVRVALSKFTPREIAPRARIDDDQLRQLIRTNWYICGGRSGRLLRFLRDVAKVACEQSRFAELWREVRVEQER